MSTRFFTNHGERTLFKKFRGVFESNPDIECFDARGVGCAAWEAEINARVARRYGLTLAEIKLVEEEK